MRPKKKLQQACWGAKWMRQRKRDQLHIFRRTLIGEEPLSFQGHFPIFVKSAPQITSLISTGQRTDPNEGQLHSFFPPTIFKASQCGRRSSKYQSYKACGHLGRRRSTSMDKRRREGGRVGSGHTGFPRYPPQWRTALPPPPPLLDMVSSSRAVGLR